MAKIIKYRLGRYLPEYNLLKKNKLFSSDEIRKVQKKRAKFLYRITKQPPTIVDYIEYITYERELLAIMSKRAKRRNLKIKEIKGLMIEKIKKLYTDGLMQFPHDLRFWQAFIIFLKFAKIFSVVTNAFDKMLVYHGDKPDVWLQAALWEYDVVSNFVRVNNLFVNGLQRHPQNENLNDIFFKIMLEDAAKMSSELKLQRRTESEQSLGLARVIFIYNGSKIKINNIQYSCKLLSLAEKYPFTQALQKVICLDLINHFNKCPLAWNTLAQRELNGFNLCDLLDKPDSELDKILLNKNENGEPMEVDSKTKPKKRNRKFEIFQMPNLRTVKKRIELCWEVYSTAVDELQVREMWNYFLNAMLDLNKNLKIQKKLKRTKLNLALQAAHQINQMSDEHYVTYVKLLKEIKSTKEETLLQIMKTATLRYPTSAVLWEQYMNYYILKDGFNEVEDIFAYACENLDDDQAFPLYKTMLQFYLAHFDLKHKIEPLFDEACSKSSEKYTQIRLLYLEYSARTKPFEDVRELYNNIINCTPPSLELHSKMAFLESQRLTPDIEKWRQCHEYAVLYFGKISVPAWMNYLRFEQIYGDPLNLPALFDRAKDTLEPKFVDELILEHRKNLKL